MSHFFSLLPLISCCHIYLRALTHPPSLISLTTLPPIGYWVKYRTTSIGGGNESGVATAPNPPSLYPTPYYPLLVYLSGRATIFVGQQQQITSRHPFTCLFDRQSMFWKGKYLTGQVYLYAEKSFILFTLCTFTLDCVVCLHTSTDTFTLDCVVCLHTSTDTFTLDCVVCLHTSTDTFTLGCVPTHMHAHIY